MWPQLQSCKEKKWYVKVCSEIKETTFWADHVTTISGHSIANYINIFPKTKVLTVILRCLTSLNLNWIKSDHINHTKKLCFSILLEKNWKFKFKKWPFLTICGHFFGKYIDIFHKTEIQTVILRCLMSSNLNWYKSYDTKRKNSKNTNLCFWTKLQKNGNGNISVLCYNFWTNQNLDQFRPVKHVKMTVWTSVLW